MHCTRGSGHYDHLSRLLLEPRLITNYLIINHHAPVSVNNKLPGYINLLCGLQSDWKVLTVKSNEGNDGVVRGEVWGGRGRERERERNRVVQFETVSPKV